MPPRSSSSKVMTPSEINEIKNKEMRMKLFKRFLRKKRQVKAQVKKEVQNIIRVQGKDAVPKYPVKTIEKERIKEETLVETVDSDIEAEEATDEYAKIYQKKSAGPQVLLTSSERPHKKLRTFIKQLHKTLPQSSVRWRPPKSITALIKGASKKNYTDLVVVNEDSGRINSLLLVHLPAGPTAYFRLSNVKTCKELKANPENIHIERPEILLNNFTTRLGRTVGRMLGALFHHTPDYESRRVCTFHNQRDFIFFRNHIYQFKSNEKVGIRELGPRFTLKLKWIQEGAMEGDYEFVSKRREQETSRYRFML